MKDQSSIQDVSTSVSSDPTIETMQSVGDEQQIVNLLWSRSVDPLRAALMASQLYRKLASLPHLRADQPSLLAQSDVRVA